MKKAGLLALSALLIIGFGLFGLGNRTKVSAAAGDDVQLVDTDAAGDYPNGTYENSINNLQTTGPIISSDDQHVAFTSTATNLTDLHGDSNTWGYVYEKSLQTGDVSLVGVGTGASAAGATQLSYNGQYVMFKDDSAGTWLYDRYDSINNHDLIFNQPTSVSPNASMSNDGRFVVYNNEILVGSTWTQEVYVYDQLAGSYESVSLESTLISKDSSGNPGTGGNSYAEGISCSGNVVAFYSNAPNITGGSETNSMLAILGPNGLAGLQNTGLGQFDTASIACDGLSAIFHDNVSTTYYNRISGSSSNTVYYAPNSVSENGCYRAYTSAGNAYVQNMCGGGTYAVTTTGRVPSNLPIAISPDGTKVAFWYNTPPTGDATDELISGLNTGTSSPQVDLYMADTGF